MDNKKNDMKDELLGKSTIKRRKAALLLRKKFLKEDYCDILFDALQIEEGTNSWQTKLELIKTIGVRKCVKAKDYLRLNYINGAEDYCILGMSAATSYVRLSRNGLNDVLHVVELINSAKYCLVEGALEALGYDCMVPLIDEQKYIVDKCKAFGNDRPKGYTDPRYGLAAACAKWDKDVVEEFLENCILSSDVPLKYVAEKSIQGKYVKLR